MTLQNVNIAGSAGNVNISVADGRITGISAAPFKEDIDTMQFTFENALIFPGLINSHDHLDFNLFPQLGDQIYNNYTEWGNYIHTHYKNEIADVLKVPGQLRAGWGIYKNLLCGVTTVVNHAENSGFKSELITVLEGHQSLHSVHFEKHWKIKLNNPFKKKLSVNIHVGEGTDQLTSTEIDKLLQYNFLKRPLIGVHGVSMSVRQSKKFKALVWCPESNHFLLNKTARVDALAKGTKILFGTDSTLTGNWDIWHHLRSARATGLMDDRSLYNSLTESPAAIWQLNSGKIAEGKDADLVIAKQQVGKAGLDAFFSLTSADLLMVIHKGKIGLFDESLLPQMGNAVTDRFSKILIRGIGKYVKGDLSGLIKKIREFYPAASFPVNTNTLVKL